MNYKILIVSVCIIAATALSFFVGMTYAHKTYVFTTSNGSIDVSVGCTEK